MIYSGWREMNWLMLINHGMHMPIYCISGPWFRKEVVQLLTGFCVRKDQELDPSYSTSQSQTQSKSETLSEKKY